VRGKRSAFGGKTDQKFGVGVGLWHSWILADRRAGEGDAEEHDDHRSGDAGEED
jgi:hypothetical protein